MRKAFVTAVVIGVIALAWEFSARGQVQPVPGPGSGVVTVTGRVEIADGMIQARQNGDWRVAVANVPDVRVVNTPTVTRAPLPFVKAGAKLQVTWPEGSVENVRVTQPAGGGWCLIDSNGRARWVNLDLARYVDETR
jgi:hypothetical protein